MLVIDITINREKRTHEIGAVRIVTDTINVYKWGPIKDGKVVEFGKVEHTTKCGALVLTKLIFDAIFIDEDMHEKVNKWFSDAEKAQEEKERLELFLYIEAQLKKKENGGYEQK